MTEGDEEVAGHPTGVQKGTVVVVVDLGHVGEGAVGHGEGDESGHDQSETGPASLAGPGEEDDDQGDHDDVTGRVGEREGVGQCRSVMSVVEGLEDGHPTGEEHRSGDDAAVEDPLEPVGGASGGSGEEEYAGHGQGNGGEEADVGQRGEGDGDVADEVVVGPESFAGPPGQAGSTE
jgi:hypothetical protein